MAVYYGHYDCVRLLLRWGAKVNVRMSGGATPLFLAVEKGPAAVARLLLKADWTQRKLRDYFLRPLARLTNRVSPRGYQTYDWEE